MKRIILSFIGLLIFNFAYCQHIHYQKTLDEALTQARKSNKLVFINLPAPVIPSHPLKLALTNREIIKLYNKNFINYTINYTDPAAVQLIKKYKITLYPSYLFIDTLGNLVYKETSGSPSMYKYIDMSAKALTAQATGRTLTNYNARYSRMKDVLNTDIPFLKDYIMLREELGYEDNAELIERYATFVRAEAADVLDYKTVLFILKAGPIAYGQTHFLCYYINSKVTDSIYKTEPLALRTLINNRIITNTINNAVTNKNLSIAEHGAQFAAATWSATNKQKGAASSAGKMVDYYRGINDTATYFKVASAFYNNYDMNISADSAARIDKEIINSMDFPMAKYINNPNNTLGNAERVSEIANRPNRVATLLNSGAYSFYTLGTHNQTYLASAMLWSKRAIELYPDYHNYDTLAHLLYRLNLFEEAKFTQNTAVKLAIKNKAGANWINYLKTEQRKIKNNLL